MDAPRNGGSGKGAGGQATLRLDLDPQDRQLGTHEIVVLDTRAPDGRRSPNFSRILVQSRSGTAETALERAGVQAAFSWADVVRTRESVQQ